MEDYDYDYFNRQNAVISELVRQVTSMCDDIQMRLDEMDFVLEEMRVTHPPVPDSWIGKTLSQTYKDDFGTCNCEICRASPPDYRMD